MIAKLIIRYMALYKINNSTQARFRFLSLVAVHKALKDSALCTDRSKAPAYEFVNFVQLYVNFI